VRIAAWAACDMLPTTMAKLQITSTDLFDIFVLIQDLNTVGEQKGAPLKQGKTLYVQLQEDSTNQINYHWAAEEIVVPGQRARHLTGAPGPQPVNGPASLTISLTNNGVPLPFMFRPYP
jgi:hypothetical protein